MEVVIEYLRWYFLSLMPAVEPRYTVPAMIATGFSPFGALVVGTAAVLTLAVVVTELYELFDKIFEKIFGGIWIKSRERARKALKRYIEKYGRYGLTIFVFIPLPGTGIWTGAIVARFLGVRRRDVVVYSAIGGLLSMLFTALPLFLRHIAKP